MCYVSNEPNRRIIAQEVYGDEQSRYLKEIDAQWRVIRGDLDAFVRTAIKERHEKTYKSFEVSQLNFARKITKKRAQAYAEDNYVSMANCS